MVEESIEKWIDYGGKNAIPDHRLVVGTKLWQLALKRDSLRCLRPVLTPAVHGFTAEGASISNATPHIFTPDIVSAGC